MNPVPEFSSYQQVRAYLYGLRNTGIKYGIERMQRFVAALGHPQRQFPSIHVAGTNGKGSVCTMLEAMYRASGYKTGLYTSPHLVRQGERIQVDREIFSEAAIVESMKRLYPAAQKLAEADPEDHPSFFEFMTAMALDAFAQEKVGIGILETGLGGRLDATNVVTPELCIITSISLDHTEILGDTVEKIAAEKAGIVKWGVPVVIGRLPQSAESVIRSIAAERHAPVFSVRERFGEETGHHPTTNLSGDFQRWNAGAALLATELLQDRFAVQPETALAALQQVHFPGRWQRLEFEGRTVILDAAHNPEGAAMLDLSLKRLIDDEGRRPVIVSGALGLERARHLLTVVKRHARDICLVRPNQPRACTFEEMEAVLEHLPSPQTGRPNVHRAELRELFAHQKVRLGESDDTIVITGSIYLIGEVAELLLEAVPTGGGLLQDRI